MGNRGAGVPSWLREHWTTFPWILIPIRALHRKSLSQASLNISLLEDKPLGCSSPTQRCCGMLIFPGTVQSSGLQGARNYQVTISKKLLSCSFWDKAGWALSILPGRQHPAQLPQENGIP